MTLLVDTTHSTCASHDWYVVRRRDGCRMEIEVCPTQEARWEGPQGIMAHFAEFFGWEYEPVSGKRSESMNSGERV